MKQFRLKLIGSPGKRFDALKKKYVDKYLYLSGNYYPHEYDSGFKDFYNEVMDIDCNNYIDTSTIKEFIEDINGQIEELDIMSGSDDEYYVDGVGVV